MNKGWSIHCYLCTVSSGLLRLLASDYHGDNVYAFISIVRMGMGSAHECINFISINRKWKSLRWNGIVKWFRSFFFYFWSFGITMYKIHFSVRIDNSLKILTLDSLVFLKCREKCGSKRMIFGMRIEWNELRCDVICVSTFQNGFWSSANWSTPHQKMVRYFCRAKNWLIFYQINYSQFPMESRIFNVKWIIEMTNSSLKNGRSFIFRVLVKKFTLLEIQSRPESPNFELPIEHGQSVYFSIILVVLHCSLLYPTLLPSLYSSICYITINLWVLAYQVFKCTQENSSLKCHQYHKQQHQQQQQQWYCSIVASTSSKRNIVKMCRYTYTQYTHIKQPNKRIEWNKNIMGL